MIVVTVDTANITSKDEALLALARHVGDAGLRALGIDFTIRAETLAHCTDGQVFDGYAWAGDIAFSSKSGGLSVAAAFGETFPGTMDAWNARQRRTP